MANPIDPTHFRRVLGDFPTGVVVVTALDAAGDPIGMTIGSFASVSLDPPLVAFFPSKTSDSWRSLRQSGDRFCVNVLSAEQEEICAKVATRKTDKFIDIPWQRSPEGNPMIDGALAHIDCHMDAIHDAGDHDIVIGRVLGLDAQDRDDGPLVFFRGQYGSFRPLASSVGRGR